MAAQRTLNPFVQVRVLARQPQIFSSREANQRDINKTDRRLTDKEPLVGYARTNEHSGASASLFFYSIVNLRNKTQNMIICTIVLGNLVTGLDNVTYIDIGL